MRVWNEKKPENGGEAARQRRRTRARGPRTFNKGGQIKSLGGYRWDVASESKEGVWYRVSYATKSPTCECEYHTTGGQCRCKHIAAVEHLLLVAAESEYDPKEIVIERQDLKCPKCPSKEHTRDGWYYGEHQKKRRYRCSKCGRRFRDNLGFEYRHTPPVYITLALMLCGMGLSVANIRMTLGHLGVSVHEDTITRWAEHYVKLVDRYAKTLRPPRISDKWGCDEKQQNVNGKDWWIVAVMDLGSRFVLAWDTSSTKQNYNAAPLLRAARDAAGKVPRIFVTDGLAQFHIEYKRVFYTVKGLMSIHIRDIHIRNLICNTNKQERLNGELAARFAASRGIKKEDSIIFAIAIIHHNFIKPHGGIGGRTPARAAGIDIRGADTWLTLIQNAASLA